MKKIVFNFIKIIIILIIGMYTSIAFTYYANTYNSSEITYDNRTSGSTKTNVKDAVDELYGKVSTMKKVLCKRATTLHKQEGNKNFGSLGTAGTLISGDAFDCDVNRDGVYNATNERFYYVTDLDTHTAVLIYYSNTSSGVADPSKMIAYHSSAKNNLGPVTAVSDLPSTSQWQTRIYSNPRQITNENGGTTTSAGNIVSYNYGDRAARLLTTQEMSEACNKTISELHQANGIPSECYYLLENTNRFNSSAPGDYWLENPKSDDLYSIWTVRARSYAICVGMNQCVQSSLCGARPTIEVLKSDIAY